MHLLPGSSDRGNFFWKLDLLPEILDFVLKLFDSFLCGLTVAAGGRTLFQGTLMEPFFAVILAFYGMGNPPDPFFTRYI